MAEWKCERCGGVANDRAGRRKHMKCPPTQMERTQMALAVANEEWCHDVQEAARAGSEVARRILVKIPEAKKDLALLRKMAEKETARMAAMGLKLDGSPLNAENETNLDQNTATEGENNG